MKKILIVDDHPIMRLGVRQLIEQAMPDTEIAEASSLALAVKQAAAFKPEMVILDLSLPDTSGTEGVSTMLRAAPNASILILSLNSEAAYAARLLKMGVAGYLPKDLASDELINAIHRIKAGKRYITQEMADHLVDLMDGTTTSQAPHELLSAQEYRVLLLTASGKNTIEIGEIMHLSAKTVSTYRARILEKTGWKNNVELTKYCVQNGLTDNL